MDGPRGRGKKEKSERNTTYGRIVLIGVFGAVIWGLVGYLSYLLNFTKYGPALILTPLFGAKGYFNSDAANQFSGILALAVVSIFVGIVYKWTLGRVKIIWVSIAFGLILWVFVFYILQPLVPGLLPVSKLDRNTIIPTLCLFVLYGLFVGYSIAYDMTSSESSRMNGQ